MDSDSSVEENPDDEKLNQKCTEKCVSEEINSILFSAIPQFSLLWSHPQLFYTQVTNRRIRKEHRT